MRTPWKLQAKIRVGESTRQDIDIDEEFGRMLNPLPVRRALPFHGIDRRHAQFHTDTSFRSLMLVKNYGNLFYMNNMQKITAHVPLESLRRAQAATGKGITETVRLGLDLLASARAAEELRRLRGKARLDLDLTELPPLP